MGILDRLVKNADQVQNPTVRASYGRLSGIVGICSNLLLFFMKLLTGWLAGSIAIMADAFNNLTDAASSVVTLVGFHLSGKGADEEHPFGHGRIEYIAGGIVSAVIILVGFELLRTSVERIMNPTTVEFTPLVGIILAISIGLKLLQFFFYRSIARKLKSTSMEATAKDSLSDVASTLVILLGGVAGLFLPFSIDGFLGLFVAILILRGGISSAKDTLNPLLGTPASRELVEDITKTVLAHPEILGMHDLVVHDYGPGRSMMSLHAEIDHRGDILMIHDVIDEIERELALKFRTVAVIHMDPLVIDDPQVNALRVMVARLVKDVDERLTIHDFRMTSGGLHTNLIFDVAVPYSLSMADGEIGEAIRNRIADLDGTYFAVIEIDRVYAE